ncbi:MAG TPA: 50S ribosomal protein L5, partial [Candidatus Thermoplasmatota archaeon]|nr:50S ribosomal protein L5 [Candidatus Thermoplasmatota archaeon]
ALKTFTYDNVMRHPRLEKVVVNIGVGEGGEKLIKAEKVLGMVTGKKPVRTLSKVNNREWGLKPGMPIGAKVTLRGDDARAFLKKAFDVRNGIVPWYNFDDGGNLNFGVPDYTDFPGMKYDPDIGIYGMNITAVISRAGARIRGRRLLRSRIPGRQRVDREEATAWVAKEFGVQVVE